MESYRADEGGYYIILRKILPSIKGGGLWPPPQRGAAAFGGRPPLWVPLWMVRFFANLFNIPFHLPYRIPYKIPYRVPLFSLTYLPQFHINSVSMVYEII